MTDFSEIIADYEMSVASAEVMSLSSVLDKLADFKMILKYIVIIVAAATSIAKTSQTISCKDLKMFSRLL